MSATGTGIWLFPDASAPDLVSAFQVAESSGLDEVWVGDEGAPNRDPFAVLAAAAVKTRSTKLGLAVTNPYVRHPAVAASAMMTVQELSGGRAILGVGAGGGISLDPLGLSRHRPMHSVREFVRLARAVSTATATDGYKPPDGAFRVTSLPIYIGSRSEGLNRLASAMAGGVFIGPTPSFLLNRAFSWVKSVNDIPVALYVNAVFDRDELEWLRPRLVQALRDSPEVTRHNFGLEDTQVTDAITALAHDDDEPARKLVTDEIMAHFVFTGNARQIALRLAQLARSYRPASIGICLRTSSRPEIIERSAEVLRSVKTEIG